MESGHIFTYGYVYSGKLNKVKTQTKCWSATLHSVKLLPQSLTLVLALLSQMLPRKVSCFNPSQQLNTTQQLTHSPSQFIYRV